MARVQDAQLMDTKRYFSGERVPPLEVSPGAVLSERLGEYSLAALLANYLPFDRAFQSARGWNNDRAELFQDGSGYRLAWSIEQQSETGAAQLESALRDAYRRRSNWTPEISRSGRTVWVRLTVQGNVNRQGYRSLAQ